jgi:hypothetical protein
MDDEAQEVDKAGYEQGPTRKLGPSSLEHHADGSVSIEGERLPDAPSNDD